MKYYKFSFRNKFQRFIGIKNRRKSHNFDLKGGAIMASVVLKDIKTCKKGKAVIRVFSFTDVEVQKHYGSKGEIEEKVRLVLMRSREQHGPEYASI